MSAEHIIAILKDLVSVHVMLNEQAKEKTECLKNGNLKDLETLMGKEEATVARLEKLEKARIREVNEFFSKKGISTDDVALSQLSTLVNSAEKQELFQVEAHLVHEVNELKLQNTLNHELIEQSLQFVNVSLNLLDPAEDVSGYQPPDRPKGQEFRGRSLFDSKA